MARHEQTAVAGTRRGFRPDVEGLRAVAVLAVVLYHAAVPGIGGGYVGVDVFFVISGFLITGLLWRELENSHTISLPAFYARRARRLLPAAMLVLVITVVASVAWLPPLQARSVTKDGLASAFYVSNIRFAIQGTDYLAQGTPPSSLLHYWSLAVEEQFYLVWPAVVLLAGLAWRHRRRVPVAPVVAALAAIAVGSFIWSLDWTTSNPPWAFFSLPTRAWELATGGLIALAVPALRRLPHGVAVPLGWLGLATIVASCIAMTGSTPFPGTAALAPVLGTAAVIAAGCSTARVGAHVLLGRRPMQVIGGTSYSWYLWHWPVLILAPALFGHSLNLGERLIAVLLSAVLARVTFVMVEDPIRFARPLRARPGRSLVFGGTLSVAALLASVASAQALPSLHGAGPAAAPIVLPSVSAPPATHAARAPSGTRTTQPPSPLQLAEAPVAAAIAQAVNTRNVPPNLQPPLANAQIDKAAPFFDGCALSWTDTVQGDCSYADTSSPKRIVLFGDSHAAQWQPTFDAIATAHHWRLESLNKTTCPPLELPIFSPYLGRDYTECEQWRQEILARIRTEHPALVVLGVARHYDPSYHFTVYSKQWLDGMSAMVREIRAMGVQVLVMGAIPKPPQDIPTCLSAHVSNATACTLDRATTVNAAGIRAEQAATESAGGHYLNLIPLFCTATRCPVIVGNNLVYRDDNHLTTYYATWLAPVIGAELQTIGAP